MEFSEAGLKELASQLGHDPMAIGEQILRSLGYTVSSFGYGYNSTRVEVVSTSGETVCAYSIGD